MEPREPLFEGLELTEPSPEADARVLRQAGCLARGRRAGRSRRMLLLVACVLALAPALLLLSFITRGRLLPPSPEGENVARADSLERIREMREDLDQIKEMAELIPAERREDQETIETRIRDVLGDLEKLEVRLEELLQKGFTDGQQEKGGEETGGQEQGSQETEVE